MTTQFAAVHLVAIGTKRTSQDIGPFVRFRGAGSIGRRNTGGKCLLAFRIQTFWLSLSGRTTLFR